MVDTGPFQFRNQFYSIPVPPWLRAGNAERYMYTLELCRDLLCEKAFEAMTIRLPGAGDPSNLPWLAFDRNLQRGPAESNASFAARLTGAGEAWGRSGSAEAVLEQLQAYLSNLQPGVGAALPLLTIVSNPTNTSPTYVTWTQLYQGDAQGAPATLTTVSPGNFAWSSTAGTWWRWLILPMSLVATGLSGSAAATGAATASACFTSPGQLVGGVWVPATSGTPVNFPWLTITGLSGLAAAQVGQWLTLSGSIHPANNDGTFQIVQVLSPTSCVVANPFGIQMEAGPLAWSIGAYPFIGPGPAWGAPGVVFGQGELVTPPIDTGALPPGSGVWVPSSIVGATSQPTISWGLNCRSAVIVSIRGITKLWKSAGTYYPYVVVAFDCGDGTAGSAYSPNSAEGTGNPDGTFGSVGKLVTGVWVPARLITSTWDAYCQGTGIAQNCSVENMT